MTYQRARTEIQEIEPVVLLLAGLSLPVTLRITTPYNQDASDKRTSMTDSWTRDLPRGLQERRGQRRCREQVQVVPNLIPDQAAEQEQLSGLRRHGRKRRAISWEWRRRRLGRL